MRAFISVFDKTGVAEFAKGLAEQGFELVSTGGTYKELCDKGIPAIEISEITGFTELLGGKVKSLHPAIHAGILAYRNKPADMQSLTDNGVAPIDVVVCNLYPFEEAAKKNADLPELIENIDIGGVTLLRSSGKNFASVTSVFDPADYAVVLAEMASNNGETTYELRKRLAIKSFQYVADYDALIAKELNK